MVLINVYLYIFLLPNLCITQNIQVSKFEIRNQHSCLPLLTFGSKSLGSFLLSADLFKLCKQQQKIFILGMYK